MPDHRKIPGMKRLAAEASAKLAYDRAAASGLTGLALATRIANDMLRHLREDMQSGQRFAEDSVAKIRAAQGYDPALHGETDDEIADRICEKIEQRRREVLRPSGSAK